MKSNNPRESVRGELAASSSWGIHVDHDEFIILKFIKSTSWFQNMILPSSHLVPDMFGYLAILLLNFITSSWKGCHPIKDISKVQRLHVYSIYIHIIGLLRCLPVGNTALQIIMLKSTIEHFVANLETIWQVLWLKKALYQRGRFDDP